MKRKKRKRRKKKEAAFTKPTESNSSEITRNSVWWGPLFLKRHLVQLQLTYISGNKALTEGRLIPGQGLILKRLVSDRTISSQFLQHRKACILLAQAYGLNSCEKEENANILIRKIIPYLDKKKATGLIKLQETAKGTYYVQLYAPSLETKRLLIRLAPSYLAAVVKKPHLLMILFGNKHYRTISNNVDAVNGDFHHTGVLDN